MFIIVAGNIGSGKVHLVNKLSKELSIPAYKDEQLTNPYLERYYADPATFAFRSQLFFLQQALAEQVIMSSEKGSIQHRSVYEHFQIFCRDLYDRSLIEIDDFNLLSELYRVMTAVLKPPDLLLLIDMPAESLLERIKSRGRQMERRVDLAHLERLNKRYNHWFENWQGVKMKIEGNRLDELDLSQEIKDVLAKT